MQGTIKKVISNKGYGFIETDNHEGDLFFHKSNLDNIDFSNLREGTAIDFEISDGRRGPEATQIKLAGASDDAPASEEEEEDAPAPEESSDEEEEDDE